MRLKGKTVLITGASSGIGEATAVECARLGALPILVARRRKELERVAQRIGKEKCLIISADISDKGDRERIAREVDKSFGQLHALVNNAGITAHGRFDKTDPLVLRKIMDLNFFAMAQLTMSLLPLMKKAQGEKVILLVSTPSGLRGIPGRFAYSASKAAGHMLMESIRLELAADGFRSVIFCPGYTRTGLRTSGLTADGAVLREEQARGAKTPEYQAGRLCSALETSNGVVVTDLNGRAVYWLRTLWPSMLDRLMSMKLKKDF